MRESPAFTMLQRNCVNVCNEYNAGVRKFAYKRHATLYHVLYYIKLVH